MSHDEFFVEPEDIHTGIVDKTSLLEMGIPAQEDWPEEIILISVAGDGSFYDDCIFGNEGPFQSRGSDTELTCVCQQCGAEWKEKLPCVPHNTTAKTCPKCGSEMWDHPCPNCDPEWTP